MVYSRSRDQDVFERPSLRVVYESGGQAVARIGWQIIGKRLNVDIIPLETKACQRGQRGEKVK
jgi:hypothetical protein